jgi:hypothetical protein
MSKKYCIEGNIDFYREININDERNDNLNYDDICLITNEPLIDKFVTMECGHKFNYIPLYNDLFKQKYCTNMMEEYRLKINEIRCPYCRSISTQLIPFYENFCIIKDLFIRKIIGVNNYNLSGNIENLYNNTYYREKSLWFCEQIKIEKYKKQQIKEEAKEAKLKAKEEKIRVKEELLKKKEEAKEAKLKAKEEKIRVKEELLKKKEEAKEAKLKAKDEKIRVKEELLKKKEEAKEAKLKAKDEKIRVKEKLLK